MLFDCLLAGGAGTLPAEAVVDASEMQGATIANALIGISPPSASGTLPEFRGAHKYEMQGVTLTIFS